MKDTMFSAAGVNVTSLTAGYAVPLLLPPKNKGPPGPVRLNEPLLWKSNRVTVIETSRVCFDEQQ